MVGGALLTGGLNRDFRSVAARGGRAVPGLVVVAHRGKKQARRILGVTIVPLAVVTEAKEECIHHTFVHLRTDVTCIFVLPGGPYGTLKLGLRSVCQRSQQINQLLMTYMATSMASSQLQLSRNDILA